MKPSDRILLLAKEAMLPGQERHIAVDHPVLVGILAYLDEQHEKLQRLADGGGQSGAAVLDHMRPGARKDVGTIDAMDALNRAAAHIARARSAAEAAAAAGAPPDSIDRATEHMDNAGRQLFDALQGLIGRAPRFEEEKPPTPKASAYEPEPEE